MLSPSSHMHTLLQEAFISVLNMLEPNAFVSIGHLMCQYNWKSPLSSLSSRTTGTESKIVPELTDLDDLHIITESCIHLPLAIEPREATSLTFWCHPRRSYNWGEKEKESREGKKKPHQPVLWRTAGQRVWETRLEVAWKWGRLLSLVNWTLVGDFAEHN